jgi:sulfatase maturation enzyme AslB (radical SAM superfamily)
MRRHGFYKNLQHPDKNKINHNGEDYQKYEGNEKNNPFIEAFWRWWPELENHLQELRITGGEPLLSNNVWTIIDKFTNPNLAHINLAINSNLMVSGQLIDKLINKSHQIKQFDLYTSCEATGQQAEYIRDGLRYSIFMNNLEKTISKGKFSSVNVMLTINSLCLFSITDFLDQLVELKSKYGIRFPVWTLNIIKYPAFMTPLVLPIDIRNKINENLRSWLESNKSKPYITDMELEHVYRLIKYLEKDPPSNLLQLQQDFKSFFTQYDRRRKKNITETFPSIFTQWYNTIE